MKCFLVTFCPSDICPGDQITLDLVTFVTATLVLVTCPGDVCPDVTRPGDARRGDSRPGDTRPGDICPGVTLYARGCSCNEDGYTRPGSGGWGADIPPSFVLFVFNSRLHKSREINLGMVISAIFYT